MQPDPKREVKLSAELRATGDAIARLYDRRAQLIGELAELGMSTRELAEIVGLSHTSIARLLKGAPR